MKRGLNTIIVGCAVTLLTFSSCKKDNIDLPQANDPVFTAEGIVGGESFSLVAGDDNAYMYTKTESVNGVKLFKGELSNGAVSLEMGIYDGHIDMPGHHPVDEIQVLNIAFAEAYDEPIVVLSKEMLNTSQNISSVDWYVNNVFEGTNEAYISEPGKYNVCALIEFQNGQTEDLCNEIIIGYERSANFSIDHGYQQGNLVAGIGTTGEAVDSVHWYIDESFVSNANQLYYQMDSSLHHLRARVFFENGVVRTKTVLADGFYGMNSVDDFTIFELMAASAVMNQDYNVTIKLEMNGTTFVSDHADNTESTLTLTGIEYYGKNANNKSVYKVSGIVNAVVMETVSEKMYPIEFTTTFGVEIP